MKMDDKKNFLWDVGWAIALLGALVCAFGIFMSLYDVLTIRESPWAPHGLGALTALFFFFPIGIAILTIGILTALFQFKGFRMSMVSSFLFLITFKTWMDVFKKHPGSVVIFYLPLILLYLIPILTFFISFKIAKRGKMSGK